jgi:hypothetical protein
MLAINIEAFQVIAKLILTTDPFAGIRFTIITFQVSSSEKTETFWATNQPANFTLPKSWGNMLFAEFNFAIIATLDRRNVLMDNLLRRTNSNCLLLEILDTDRAVSKDSNEIFEVGSCILVVLPLRTILVSKSINSMLVRQVPDLIIFFMKPFKEPVDTLYCPQVDVGLNWSYVNEIIGLIITASPYEFDVFEEEVTVNRCFSFYSLAIDSLSESNSKLIAHLLFEVRKEEQIP